MKANRPIDRHYAFISNQNQLAGFDRNGDLSAYFFPRMDAFQNLDHAARWLQSGTDIIPVTRRRFRVDFAFSGAWDRLHVTVRGNGLRVRESYGFEAAGNGLEVEIAILEGKVDAYHHFLSWKFYGAAPFHGIVRRADGLEVIKHDLRLSLVSSAIQTIGIVDPHADNAHVVARFEAIIRQRPAAAGIYTTDRRLSVAPPPWPTREFLSSKMIVSFQPEAGRISARYTGAGRTGADDSAGRRAGRASGRYFRFLPPEASLAGDRPPEDPLVPASLAVLNMLQAPNGAMLASYEQDEAHRRCGGYGFCWGRDGALIAAALQSYHCAGAKAILDYFLSAAQPHEALPDARYLKQRHQTNGLPAPGWGDQFDETGSILWSYANYLKQFKDDADRRRRREQLLPLVDFLFGIIDPELFLFQPTIDLWEERFGYHLYSQLACLHGLDEGLRLLDEETRAQRYPDAPALLKKVRAAIESHFLLNGLALRSILKPPTPISGSFEAWRDDMLDGATSAAHPHLAAYGMDTENLEIFRKLFEKGFRPDWVPDIANLAMVYPFDGLNLPPRTVAKNIAHLDRFLLEPQSRLHYRYARDPYIGGNAWVLATLWLGICDTLSGRPASGRRRLETAGRAANRLGLLPEQVDTACRPCWIQPLCWSHAFYLTLSHLLEMARK